MNKKEPFPITRRLIDSLVNQNKTGKVDPQDFADLLEMNEDSMGEGAAMMATCQALGLTWEEGHELLIELSEGDDDEDE